MIIYQPEDNEFSKYAAPLSSIDEILPKRGANVRVFKFLDKCVGIYPPANKKDLRFNRKYLIWLAVLVSAYLGLDKLIISDLAGHKVSFSFEREYHAFLYNIFKRHLAYDKVDDFDSALEMYIIKREKERLERRLVVLESYFKNKFLLSGANSISLVKKYNANHERKIDVVLDKNGDLHTRLYKRKIKLKKHNLDEDYKL